jgi:hypothetical protein
MNVAAFIKAASIIEGHDIVEEFLACNIWPLSESCEFEVERKETPLSKVMMPMPNVTPTIGKQKSEAAFKAWIVATANLLVGNYCMMELNSCMGLRHGLLNHVFELAGVLCQPRLEPIARVSKKRQAVAAAAQPPVLKKSTEKQKCMKGSSRSGDETSE